MRRLWNLALLLVAVSNFSLGQMQSPTPLTLTIVVTIDGDSAKAKQVTIELMDPMDSGSRMNRAITDSEGRAIMSTVSGSHRIRITGPGILPYESDLEIMPNEMMHMERIRVQAAIPSSGSGLPSGTPIPAIRLKIPDSARKLFEKGSDAMHKQKWEDSRKFFQEAITQYSDYDMAYNGLGVSEGQLKNNEASEAAFSKAIALNPKYAEAQRNLARVLLGEHKNAEALIQLKASLETEPNDAWALSNAAYLELQAHDFVAALDHAQKVHKLPHHETMANSHMIAAYAADALGQDEQAKQELNLYIQEDPKGPNVTRAKDMLAKLSAGKSN